MSGPTAWRLVDRPPVAADAVEIDTDVGDDDARAARVVVLDAAWTPGPDAGPLADAIAIRPLARLALSRHDPHGEALELADRLDAQAGLDAALNAGDVSLWPRRRLVAWRRLHDLILWREIIAELGIRPGETVTGDPPDALRDLLAVMGGDANLREAAAASTVRFSTKAPPSLARRVVRRGRALVRPRAPAAPVAVPPFAEDQGRLEGWFAGGRRPLLVLTDPAVHQVIDTVDGPRRLDPFLGPIVERLRGTRLDPVTIDLSSAAGDAFRTVPLRAITSVPDDPTDRAAADRAATAARTRLAGASASIDLDGIDVGPFLVEAERAFAADGLGPWMLARARIERFLADRRPAGILLVNEYGRPEWLSAARRHGIPVAAVQHGVIHRAHPGYVLPRRTAGLVLADRTYVFGPFERQQLTSGVYRDDEVRIGGSPRLDLLARSEAARAASGGDAGDDARDRAALRARLDARPGERLVVFSSTNNADIRRLVVAPALEAILDQPLPGVRLVVKLHPAEAPHDEYERLAAGLAAAGHFEPPPVSVIRDVDLYTLLRAADAHLGIYSTVLSDAVVAGVRNLVVVGLPGGDLLDYVERGVARPVRDGSDVLAALDAPPPAPDDAARAAFVADHFLSGDAGARIAADLAAWLGG